MLCATQQKNSSDDKVNFDLIVKHEDKLFTAEFLTIKNSFSPKIIEKNLDYDGDEVFKELYPEYFQNLSSRWQHEIESPFFTASMAFSNPAWLLEKIINFTETIEDLLFITSRVNNLKYLESGLEFKEAILEPEGYTIISLVVH